ncbi:hypothetical protein MRB53_008165 [Persea americana]|uniref:Uncharacterized protein n=1 Tax=Persea americana TaxID=3435 RepID=A0ACC2ML22_PERAE|nr:hypothetical protein MRB53_008165 [Persea americana]
MIQTDLSPFSSLLAVYEAQVTTPKRFNSVVVLFIEGNVEDSRLLAEDDNRNREPGEKKLEEVVHAVECAPLPDSRKEKARSKSILALHPSSIIELETKEI